MSLDLSFICPCCETAVMAKNITHNLTHMAGVAGIYECLWHPTEHGFETAASLIAPLEAGIAAMEHDPAKFKIHDAPNGWGTYDQFLPWLHEVLAAAKLHPTTLVRAWT